MPCGVRNTTPGPSTLGRNVNAHGAVVVQGRSNVVKKKEDKDRERQKVLKRPSSEEAPDEEERERKKAKFAEEFGDDDATSSKDTKEKQRKKRKKRKKPISVVIAGSSDTSQQDVTSPSLHPSSSSSEPLATGSCTQTTSRSLAVEVEILNGVKVENDADDEAPAYSSSDKGKSKAKPESLAHEHPNLDHPNLGSGSDTRSTTLEGPDQSSELARLKEQLAEQRKLLEKHQSHLAQQQQALTCQICLELLHRPYALTPCGHVTCYGCLVRWFTSDLNAEEPMLDEEQEQANEDEDDQPKGDNFNALLDSAAAKRGTFVRRRKTCPVCRGVVPDRPVEMWDIKQMVAALVKSHLVDLPLPPGEVGVESNHAHRNNTPNDPWRNVFKLGRGHHRHGGPPPPGQADDEEERVRFGWYDHEDGGVYRCIECHHELWGGMCTGCERIYLGHEAEEDDSDEEEGFFHHEEDDGALHWAGFMYLQDELRRLDEEDEDDEGDEVDVVDDYNGDYFLDGHIDDEEGAWSVRGDADADADVESSDGFIDDEERIRSGGLSGVGVEEGEESDVDVMRWTRGRNLRAGYLSEEEGVGSQGESGSDLVRWARGREEGVGSQEESGSDLARWARGRSLRARSRLEPYQDTDEESDVRLGWGGNISGGDTDQETRRSPAPSLRRSIRRRTAVVESGSSSSGGESEYHSPPDRQVRWNLRRTLVGSDSEDDDELEGDVGGDGDELWVEYYQRRIR